MAPLPVSPPLEDSAPSAAASDDWMSETASALSASYAAADMLAVSCLAEEGSAPSEVPSKAVAAPASSFCACLISSALASSDCAFRPSLGLMASLGPSVLTCRDLPPSAVGLPHLTWPLLLLPRCPADSSRASAPDTSSTCGN